MQREERSPPLPQRELEMQRRWLLFLAPLIARSLVCSTQCLQGTGSSAREGDLQEQIRRSNVLENEWLKATSSSPKASSFWSLLFDIDFDIQDIETLSRSDLEPRMSRVTTGEICNKILLVSSLRTPSRARDQSGNNL